MSENAVAGGATYQSAERALALLTSFDDAHVEQGVTELAQIIGVHKSTASRLAAVLERAGLLSRHGRRYRAAASPFERAEACGLVATAIAVHRDELADVLTRDQGKPLAEALEEVDELAVYFRMAGEDAKRLAGELPPSVSADRRILSTRVPLGVVGVVSPWNWPYTMGSEILAPALAAGNTVVWVPAPTTTACCAALTELIAGTGLDAGVFNFVPGPGPAVGNALVGHPQVAGVGFVGSVATGASVAARAAGQAQLLELGGKARWSSWPTRTSSWPRPPRWRRPT